MVQQDKGFIAQAQLLQRWRALAPREQFSLGSLGVFLLLVLLYLTLWQPAQQRLVSARSAFETQRALYVYLQGQAPAARNLVSRPQQAIDPARLQGMVTATAATRGLTIERPCSSTCNPLLLLSCWGGLACCRSRAYTLPKPGWTCRKITKWLLG